MRPPSHLAHQARMPSSPEELLQATFHSFDGSALGSLSNQFIRDASKDKDADLSLLIGQIEARLRVFLEKTIDPDTKDPDEASPSDFAVALLQESTAATDAANETGQHLRRVQGYIVGELNPLIRELRVKLREVMRRKSWLERDPSWQELTPAVGLYARLAFGRIDSEPVRSFFGVMQAMHGRDPSFPDIDYTEEFPKEKSFAWIAQVDPLDLEANEQYWLDFAQIEKRRGRPGTLPDIIHRRSNALSYELRRLANLTDPGEETVLIKSYHVLADWVEDHSDKLKPDMKSEDVLAWRVGLHFACDSSEELIAVLNAAEHIKIQRPQLFLEMMGFTPGPTYTQIAQRSHYFGGAFHLALLRSLQLELPSGDGWQTFKHRVRTLLEFNTHLPPVAHFSDIQMRMFERGLANAVSTINFDDPGSKTDLLIYVVHFIAILLPGYRMRKNWEDMLSQLSVQEFDSRCQRLRVTSPNEVVNIVRSMPKSLVGDTIFRGRVAERLADPWRLDEMIVAMQKGRDREYLPQLWQTSADALLMGSDFIDFLQTVGSWINADLQDERYALSCSKGTGDAGIKFGHAPDEYAHYPNPQEAARCAERRRRLVEDVIAVFNAHPLITKEQWLALISVNSEDLFKTNTTSHLVHDPLGLGGSPEIFTTDSSERVSRSLFRIFQPLLQQLPVDFDPAKQPSAFFRCIPIVKP